MKRTGYRESKDPKPIPKFTATRNGKPVNPKIGQIDDPAAILAQDENFKTVLAWLEQWPQKERKWNKVSDKLYSIVIDGTKIEVFSTVTHHSSKPTWGFAIFGQFGIAHAVSTIFFLLK